MDSDRRSAKRESGDGLIAFYWEGGPSRAHRVKDISRHGVFVEFEKADLSWTRCGTVIMLLLQIASAGKVEIGSLDAVTSDGRGGEDIQGRHGTQVSPPWLERRANATPLPEQEETGHV